MDRAVHNRTIQNHTIRVCQNTTCIKQGAAEVLDAFEKRAPKSMSVEGSGCLGHCGSGPNVLVLPENEWHMHMQPQDVERVIHPPQKDQLAQTEKRAESDANKIFRLWMFVIVGMALGIAIATWLITKNSYYV